MKNWSIRTRLTVQAIALMVFTFTAFSTFVLFCSHSLSRKDFDNMVSLSWGKKMAYFHHDENGQVEFYHPTPRHAEAGRDSKYRTIFYELFSTSGELLYASKSIKGLDIANPFGAVDTSVVEKNEGRFKTIVIEGEPFRLKTAPLQIEGRDYIFRAALEESDLSDQFEGIAFILLWATLILLLIGGGGCYLLIRKALRPVEKMNRDVEDICATNLNKRLPIENEHDEIGTLAKTVNRLFARLEVSFEEMKRFTSDASHELRTPLTVMRILGESALSKESSVEDLKSTISDILEENQRLIRLTEDLLALARLDRKADKEVVSFDIASQARATVDSLSVLASDRNQKIQLNVPSALNAQGHPELVRQAITSLVDNAIKYGGENSTLEIEAFVDKGRVKLKVKDNGPGIAPEHQQHLFKRFYRADTARNRKDGGTGIGLSIAQRSIDLSGGEIHLNSGLGKGTTFTIDLQAGDNL